MNSQRNALDVPLPLNVRTRGHISWIDTLKGVGIALVVLGHTPSTSLVHSLIYVFHMPLFFFISGYLHKLQPEFGSYMRKKSIHLLVPYLCFIITGTTFLVFVQLIRHSTNPITFKQALISAAWGGSRLEGPYGVLWFLTCLFLTQQLMNWLLVRWRITIVAWLVGVALLMSYANSLFFPRFSLPLDANVVLAAMPFFFAGYLLRNLELVGWRVSLVALPGFAISIYLLKRGVPIAYDMRAASYGLPFLSLVLALCCIMSCIGFCIFLKSVPLLVKPFQSLGAMSMGIMFLHKLLPAIPGYTFIQKHGGLITFIVDLMLSYFMAVVLSRSQFGRAYFFGSEKDFKSLLKRTQ